MEALAKQQASAKEASEEGGDGEAATVGEGGVGGRTIEAAAIEGKKQQTSEEAAIEGSNAGEGLSGSNVADGRKQWRARSVVRWRRNGREIGVGGCD
ncbi:hypothetical protein LXL04_021626 [Taraxacum kok-saghyz]